MTMYSNAVEAIRNVATTRQITLDAIAKVCRDDSLAALRRAATEGVDPDSPQRRVCELVAHTVTVGREDGYPQVNIPEATRQVITAAANAALLEVDGLQRIHVGSLLLHRDGSGLTGTWLPELDADYKAWDAAETYRRAQTVQLL